MRNHLLDLRFYRPQRWQLLLRLQNWSEAVLIVCLLCMAFVPQAVRSDDQKHLHYQHLAAQSVQTSLIKNGPAISSNQATHDGHHHHHDDELGNQLEWNSPHGHDHNPFDHSHETQHLLPIFVVVGLTPTRHWLANAEPFLPPNSIDPHYRPPTGSLVL